MGIYRLTLGGFIALVATMGAIWFIAFRPPDAELEPGTEAPALATGDFSLEDVESDLVLVTFWQSTDHSCEWMLPLLTRIEGEYEPERFTHVAVNLDKPEGRDASLKSFFHQRKRPENLVFAGKETIDAWKLSKVPTMYLLGADRRVVAGFVGQVSEQELREQIGIAFGSTQR